tara:strand:+ start:270 stop:785 length:516 start_codon:yes stop_codon:yes gene_type:complete
MVQSWNINITRQSKIAHKGPWAGLTSLALYCGVSANKRDFIQHMNMNKFLVNITATIFALYGLGFVFAPSQLSLLVTNAVPTTAAALTDMRATYGGMSIAVGIVLFILASKPESIRLGLAAVLSLMLGMACGRVVGFIIDGSENTIMYVYLALELGAAAAALFLLSRTRKL